MRNEDA
jgi:hypothetical protein